MAFGSSHRYEIERHYRVAALRQQQSVFEQSALGGLQGLGAQAFNEFARSNESVFDCETKKAVPSPKTLREELQSEIDEWLE